MEDSEIPKLGWLRLGDHDYSTKSDEGQGLAHIIFRHFIKRNNFQRYLGIKDLTKISEFILGVISQEVGVRDADGWVVYKTDYIRPTTGEHTYLRVGFDIHGSGSISTAYPVTKSWVESHILDINKDAEIYLL